MSKDELHRLYAILQEQLQVQVQPESMQEKDVDCTAVSMLTRRESDVLTLIASGYTRREIGAALMISGNTAATHISAIYRKLDIGSIAEATHIAIRCGVVALM
jgi:DNA-binding CsgD family transcriptional regulator